MKVKGFPWMLCASFLFLVCTAGLFAYRNWNRVPIAVNSAVPAAVIATAAATEPESSAAEATLPDHPLDLNTATLEQLDALPGIGPVIAQRILDYRAAHGSFASVTELLEVEGIGEKRLEAIWDLVTAKGD